MLSCGRGRAAWMTLRRWGSIMLGGIEKARPVEADRGDEVSAEARLRPPRRSLSRTRPGPPGVGERPRLAPSTLGCAVSGHAAARCPSARYP